MMAGTPRSSSFLPTVKCSNCGVEIEISMMGEHICSEAPPLPASFLGDLSGSYAASYPALSNASSLPNPTRTLPPRIDSSAANRSYLRAERLAPNGFPINSRSLSPLSTRSPCQPPFLMPPRSATAPLPAQPPSPELLSQDCAFPPFPVAKPRSATPTTPTSPSDINRSNSVTPQDLVHIAYFTAPLSPRNNGGRSVLQRMNTIAPGPFNVKATRDDGGQRDIKPLVVNREHERSAIPAKLNSSKDDGQPPSVSSGGYHIQRPATAGTDVSRKLSLSSISGGPRSMLDRRPPAAPSLPSEPSPPRPVRLDGDGKEDVPPLPPLEEIQPEPLRQGDRSQTFPIQPSNRTRDDGPAAPLPRRPSVGAPRPRRPTVSAANRPLDEIGSVSSYRPSKAPLSPPKVRAGGITQETSSRNEGKNNQRVEDAPALSGPTRGRDFEVGNPYHTSTESTSSNGSMRSDAKSGSSRSSPPLSDASFNPRRRPSDISRIDDLLHSVQEATEQLAENGERQPVPRIAPLSFSRPMYTRPSDQQPQIEPLSQAPESPLDPAIQNGILSPITRPRNCPPVPPLPEPPAQTPAERATARRVTSGNKGNCRGCGELIKGKSVSSADGRLTGRYHKHCFVCKTCKEPFQTADFYVLENHPYCERHYHQLNGSLCKACDRGIEGQYLETELKQKFHPRCFQCQDCRRILRDDYFEMNGRTYCEHHAFRAAQQTSMLGPGRRHPERRTTRLMMM